MNIERIRSQIKVKTNRIYLESIINNDEILKISDSARINYLKNVLRLKHGSLIRIFDQSKNEYLFKVVDIQNKYVLLEKVEILIRCNDFIEDVQQNSDEINFTAGICILKPEKMREAVDVATQMCVSCIQPIISERCQNFGVNLDKMKIWAIEASEQSERIYIPKINNPIKLQDFVNNIQDKIIVANEHFGINIKDFFVQSIISDIEKRNFDPTANKSKNIATNFHYCIIGPEGGFSDNDLKVLESPNVINVNFGSNILKSYAALAKILSFFC